VVGVKIDGVAHGSMTIPFVARAAQVSRAAAALDRARSGVPSLLLVAGDAGVGKTRYLEHVAELARGAGATVVVGHCVDFGEVGLPYLPFAEALGALHRIDPAAVDAAVVERPALGRLLPGAGAPPDEADGRLPLYEGLIDLLAAAGTAEHPLALVLEDLHWADASSRDLLRFLVARLAGQHLLVVASYRTDDLHRRHPWRPVAAELARHPRVERIDLLPFAPDELRDFTTAVAGRALPPAAVERILQRSEGNAYFAVELVEAGPDDDALPWSLADVLHARLDPLDPAVHRLVQVAAAAGRRVAEPLLRAAAAADGDPALAGPGALDQALRDAVAHHVLGEEDGRIAFRHALLAEVVYGDLLPGEKSALHRSYLRALADDPALGSPAELAAHALLAPDLDVALAASWEAAAQARRVLAPLERLHHLEVVLRLWDAAPDGVARLGVDRAAVIEEAAGAARDAGSSERAAALLRSAIDETDGDTLRRAGLRTQLARVLLAQERPRDARAEATLALADLTEPSPHRARALAVSARVALDTDLDEQAAALATEAIELARQVVAPDAESDAMTTLALLAQQSPQHTERLLREAVARATQSDDRITELRTRFNLASSRYYAGDIAGAAQLVAEGNARAEEAGLQWAEFGLDLQWLAEEIRYAAGDLSPAPPGTDPVHGWEPTTLVLAAIGLYSAVARGDEDVPVRADRIMAEWQRDPFLLHIAGGVKVDALTWAGRHDEAVELVERVIDGMSRTWSEHYLGGIWHAALALAALADAAEDDRLHGRDPAARLAAGDAFVKRARSTVELGRPRGGELGPEGRAWLARAEADHGRLHGHDDPAAWQRCVEEFAVGFRYETARSRWRWAGALLVAGDRAGAREQAATALAEAEEMGARPLADAVRALARRGRLDVPGVRLGSADVLTAREGEVLALVAQGLTNRQIGARLFVSEKTVSVHVSNLLAKLGASGRAEAVAIAHQRGLLSP
jgi:DNA-binding CsgD family transcriptional regulator